MKDIPLECYESFREEVLVIAAIESLYSRLSTVELFGFCCVDFVTKVRDDSSVPLAARYVLPTLVAWAVIALMFSIPQQGQHGALLPDGSVEESSITTHLRAIRHSHVETRIPSLALA